MVRTAVVMWDLSKQKLGRNKTLLGKTGNESAPQFAMGNTFTIKNPKFREDAKVYGLNWTAHEITNSKHCAPN